MSAAAHVDAARLLDYYLGGPNQGDDAVEEHLFDCAECSAVVDDIHRMAAAVVGLVRAGELSSGGTTALLNRMSRDRLNVRHYAIEPGETVACTVAADDDFMAGRFALPDGEFSRIDMRILDAQGQELFRVDDIVIDARQREAIMFIPARPVQHEGSGVTHYVLVAPDQDGERELARYSMDHTSLRDA